MVARRMETLQHVDMTVSDPHSLRSSLNRRASRSRINSEILVDLTNSVEQGTLLTSCKCL